MSKTRAIGERIQLTALIGGASETLSLIAQHGLKPEIREGALWVGPPEMVSDELLEVIRDNTPGLMAFLNVSDYDEQWRVAEMLAQLLPLRWPCAIPVLFVSDAEPKHKEDCKSCGELLDQGEGDSYTCGPCSRAKTVALELWMKRPETKERAAAS